MSNKLRRSKRKVKIPSKLADSICSLNKAMTNKADMEEFVESGKSGDCIQEMDMNSDVREQVSGNMEENLNVKEDNASVKLDTVHQNSKEMDGNNNTDNNKGNVWKKTDQVVNIDSDTMINNDKKVLDNSLLFVPTEIINKDRECVVFDEELVELGSRNWLNTLCGYFVGCNMMLSELRYNNEEPSKLPLWVNLLNVPLEAWTHRGISALASAVGNPIIMDALTTEIFHSGKGRMGFARVLVEVDISKGFKKLLSLFIRMLIKRRLLLSMLLLNTLGSLT
ncbi:RNA-directed DNA polymerase, eukaryota, reverse transcriptase zinc-binding domain protein [Tanacetum coccineum]